MKNLIYLTLLFIGFSVSQTIQSQTLPVGTPVLEEYWRRAQVMGDMNRDVSFAIRPLTLPAGSSDDSLLQRQGLLIGKKLSNPSSKNEVRILPITLRQQYNPQQPFGWNDGSMIPAKGYQGMLSAGVYFKRGHLSVQFQPEFVYAQNAGFSGFASIHSGSALKIFDSAFSNAIDAPERFGNGRYVKPFLGQSSIRYNLKSLSLGLSSENLWWGPGVRNSLLMSNNAPGFTHISLNTTKPIVSGIGSFEGQVVSGILKKSGFPPADTGLHYNAGRMFTEKPRGDRYMNGMTIAWQPKWTKGLFLGFSRLFYVYRQDQEPGLNGYLPILGHWFKGSVSEAQDEDSRKRDQLFSFYLRLLLPKEQAEFYIEYGRNDHAGNTRDMALEPEHSSASIVGFKKIFSSGKKQKFELMAEFTTLQIPSTNFVREQQSWYTHYQVLDGYTHRGQVIGAGIGPGGSNQTVGLNWLKEGGTKTGFMLERVVHNNDYYYAAFSRSRDYWSHWVDLSLNISKSWRHKHLLFDAQLILVSTLNFQWQTGNDMKSVYPRFSASYIF